MAKQTNSNTSPVNGAEAMYNLQIFLRDQIVGTIPISGDGLAAFDNVGTSVITAPGSGANGMDNANAYFVWRDPGSEYEWCFQRNATENNWEIVFSALDGFTGGTATTRPTATDEQALWNAAFFDTAGTYRVHFEGDNAASVGAVGVYAWSMISTENGTGDAETCIAHLPMKPGTYPELVGTRAAPTTGEPDPSVTLVGSDLTPPCACFDLSGAANAWQNATSFVQSWFCMNGTNGQIEAPVRYQGSVVDMSQVFVDRAFPANAGSSDGVGPDPRDSSDPVTEIFVGRVSRLAAQVGPKGILSHWKIKGTDRSYPNTVDIAGERYMYLQDFLIPFANGGTPLV